MIITPIKTDKVRANSMSLEELLHDALPTVEENSIIAISSKIVSLCENRVVSLDHDKETLIAKEADLYLPVSFGPYGYHFTVIGNTLVAAAGIDESNSDNMYVLWPTDPQKSASAIRAYIQEKYKVKNIGIIITDSTSIPMRRGAVGTAIAHTGFKALRSYVGEPDLFGRPFSVSVANVLTGLSAAAVLAMGEGCEQTPLCVITQMSDIEFEESDPTTEQLKEIYLPMDADLYSPFFLSAPWQKKKS